MQCMICEVGAGNEIMLNAIRAALPSYVAMTNEVLVAIGVRGVPRAMRGGFKAECAHLGLPMDTVERCMIREVGAGNPIMLDAIRAALPAYGKGKKQG
jgi:hypothetical protein